MDISLIASNQGVQIRSTSIHGILWLQTHFENNYWEAILNNQVEIPLKDAYNLSKDAESAGLILNMLPKLSIAEKI